METIIILGLAAIFYIATVSVASCYFYHRGKNHQLLPVRQNLIEREIERSTSKLQENNQFLKEQIKKLEGEKIILDEQNKKHEEINKELNKANEYLEAMLKEVNSRVTENIPRPTPQFDPNKIYDNPIGNLKPINLSKYVSPSHWLSKITSLSAIQRIAELLTPHQKEIEQLNQAPSSDKIQEPSSTLSYGLSLFPGEGISSSSTSSILQPQ